MWTSKINRAKLLKGELKKELDSFFVQQPYKIDTKLDSKSKRLIYYVTKADKVPEEISLITGDVIQNLRSSLDHLAYKLFTVGGNGTGVRGIYFPIANDFNQYEKGKDEKTKGFDQRAKDLIDSIKPYREGNKILWKIHRLSIIDKHRLLITVGSSFRSLDLGAHAFALMRKAFPKHSIPSLSSYYKPADNLFPLRVGDELFIDRPNAKPDPKMQFKFEVVLNEPNLVEGESLIETINSMIDEVESLAPKFKSLIT